MSVLELILCISGQKIRFYANVWEGPALTTGPSRRLKDVQTSLVSELNGSVEETSIEEDSMTATPTKRLEQVEKYFGLPEEIRVESERGAKAKRIMKPNPKFVGREWTNTITCGL